MGDHTTTGTPESNPRRQVGTHGNADAERPDDPPKGGQAEREMTQGDRTRPPQPSGTTPLEHEGRPKA